MKTSDWDYIIQAGPKDRPELRKEFLHISENGDIDGVPIINVQVSPDFVAFIMMALDDTMKPDETPEIAVRETVRDFTEMISQNLAQFADEIDQCNWAQCNDIYVKMKADGLNEA